MPTTDKFQGEFETSKLKKLLEKGPIAVVEKYYEWFDKNGRPRSKLIMPEFEGTKVKASTKLKYELIERLARLTPGDNVRSLVDGLRRQAKLDPLPSSVSVPNAVEFPGFTTTRPSLPFAAGGSGAGMETPSTMGGTSVKDDLGDITPMTPRKSFRGSVSTTPDTPRQIEAEKKRIDAEKKLEKTIEAMTPKPTAPAPAPAQAIPPPPGQPIPMAPPSAPAPSPADDDFEPMTPPIEEEEEKEGERPPPVPPAPPAPPVPPAPQMAAPVAPPVDAVVNKRVVSTVPRDETGLPSKIDMIPPERLSADNKTVAELKADIAYFKKTFPKELKGVKYDSRTKSIEVLKRVHKEIVAKLRAGKKTEGDKKIGIIISGSDFIKEKLKEIILENSINGLSAQDLLINVEGKEKDKTSDVGTYEIKVGADGMPSAKKEPIYRYIPEEKQAPVRLKRKPARIPLPATKYRGLEQTAKMEVRNNPFAKKQPSIRLKYSY